MSDFTAYFMCAKDDARIAGIILGMTDIFGKSPDIVESKNGRCGYVWYNVDRKIAFDITETLSSMQLCSGTSIGANNGQDSAHHQ